MGGASQDGLSYHHCKDQTIFGRALSHLNGVSAHLRQGQGHELPDQASLFYLF